MGEGSNIRKYFMENNFFIEKERLFIEKDKYYRLFEIKNKKTNVADYKFPVNIDRNDISYLNTYYDNEIKNIKSILQKINKEKNLMKYNELEEELNKILQYMEKINEKR